ncbi:hypothetical protein Tco_1036576 [Tanacetum coccineum]
MCEDGCHTEALRVGAAEGVETSTTPKYSSGPSTTQKAILHGDVKTPTNYSLRSSVNGECQTANSCVEDNVYSRPNMKGICIRNNTLVIRLHIHEVPQ